MKQLGKGETVCVPVIRVAHEMHRNAPKRIIPRPNIQLQHLP